LVPMLAACSTRYERAGRQERGNEISGRRDRRVYGEETVLAPPAEGSSVGFLRRKKECLPDSGVDDICHIPLCSAFLHLAIRLCAFLVRCAEGGKTQKSLDWWLHGMKRRPQGILVC